MTERGNNGKKLNHVNDLIWNPNSRAISRTPKGAPNLQKQPYGFKMTLEHPWAMTDIRVLKSVQQQRGLQFSGIHGAFFVEAPWGCRTLSPPSQNCNVSRPLIKLLFLLIPYGSIIKLKMKRTPKEMTEKFCSNDSTQSSSAFLRGRQGSRTRASQNPASKPETFPSTTKTSSL